MSEALRLADALGIVSVGGPLTVTMHEAAAELRRLHAENEALKAERHKVAAWMIDRGYATGHGDTTEDLLKELEWQIKEREREACAKVCDEIDRRWINQADKCAAAIRSRT